MSLGWAVLGADLAQGVSRFSPCSAFFFTKKMIKGYCGWGCFGKGDPEKMIGSGWKGVPLYNNIRFQYNSKEENLIREKKVNNIQVWIQ